MIFIYVGLGVKRVQVNGSKFAKKIEKKLVIC